MKTKEKKIVELKTVGEVEVQASPAYSLNKQDIYKAVRGLFVILAAAVITAVGDAYTGVDYTICTTVDNCINFTPFVIPVIATLLEIGRRYITAQATAKVEPVTQY